VRAERQTAGRGRRGRAWVSEPGNLYLSTLCRAQQGEGPLQQLSFVAALALDAALSAHVDAARLTLKWPNDVLLDGLKCSGILLEGSGDSVIIGFGANLAHHPEGTERPATSLAKSGIQAPLADQMSHVIREKFVTFRTLWRASGFAPIRMAWLARAHPVGTPLIARLGTEDVPGRFHDLAPDGALLLALDDGGIRAIHAGEVFGL
jgi:BirA family transcriptional regulator, biotin operon repressor / biotin---[acetyl-CoA-carboxylase] ligase